MKFFVLLAIGGLTLTTAGSALAQQEETSQAKVNRAANRIQEFLSRGRPGAAAIQSSPRKQAMQAWLTEIQQPRVVTNHPQQTLSVQRFQAGNYTEAAGDAFEALSLGEPWDWPQLLANFKDREDYTAHYRKLQRTALQQPNANVLFLLAYHERMLRHADEAAFALSQVNALLPQPIDVQISNRLLLKDAPPSSREVR